MNKHLSRLQPLRIHKDTIPSTPLPKSIPAGWVPLSVLVAPNEYWLMFAKNIPIRLGNNGQYYSPLVVRDLLEHWAYELRQIGQPTTPNIVNKHGSPMSFADYLDEVVVLACEKP